jgi:DNA segregation ATPase FtsK/SpoIIIE-like protein
MKQVRIALLFFWALCIGGAHVLSHLPAESFWEWSDQVESGIAPFLRTLSLYTDGFLSLLSATLALEIIYLFYGLRTDSFIAPLVRAVWASLCGIALCAGWGISVTASGIPGGIFGESISRSFFVQGVSPALFFGALFFVPHLSIMARACFALFRYRKKSTILPSGAPHAEPVQTKDLPSFPIHESHTSVSQLARYTIPSQQLLKSSANDSNIRDERADLDKKGRLLEEKLAYFGIQGKVVSAVAGPVVTVFEYKPAHDVKVSRVLACEDDIALALKALSVRCRAPIPGKSVIGFEVAYPQRKQVFLANIVDHGVKKELALPLALGVDIVGQPLVVDLRSVPHLLVAGATGSGKSVALSSMIVSLLLSRTPHELKFILIDPKRLEFSLYAEIPHLIFPHITEPGEAVSALAWLVDEMERRYEKLAVAGARSLEEYRARTNDMLPYIVVCIDELADLMMTAPRDVECSLTRLAQMARAAGIHLIVATQRPSVDVITGIIKANFPTRIAFRVVSKIDSRTILDASGAEKLVGKGDFLMLDSAGMLTRAHGAYVGTDEIEAVVRAAKQWMPNYIEWPRKPTHEGGDSVLRGQVEKIILECDELSISLIQRRIMEELEIQGRVLTQPGSKMKRVVR